MSTRPKYGLCTLTVFAMVGCASERPSERMIKNATVGQIECPAANMKMSNSPSVGSAGSWVAVCNDKTYNCKAIGPDVSCTQAAKDSLHR
jgi:uncharacterized protein YcfL